jgi:hypothetical protein
MQRILIALLMLPFLTGCSEKPEPGKEENPEPTKLKLLKSTTDEQLAEKLKGLTKLSVLSLYGCQMITDAGLVHLKGLSKLEELSLFYTKITDAGVKTLQESLPGCKIIR